MKRLVYLIIMYGLIYGLIFVTLAFFLFTNGGIEERYIYFRSYFLKGMCIGWAILAYYISLDFLKNKKIDLENLFKISQEKTFDLNMSKLDAIDKVKQVLLKLDAVIRKDGTNEELISAKTKMSWKSGFGENISVNIINKKDSVVEIKIFSKSRMNTWLHDGGKNLRNIEEFYKLMNQ